MLILKEVAKFYQNNLVINVLTFYLDTQSYWSALEFYSSFLNFEVCYEDDLGLLRDQMASLELGDQFIEMTKSDRDLRDVGCHLGLVIDDKETAK